MRVCVRTNSDAVPFTIRFLPFFLFVGIHWASFVNGLKVLSSLLKLGVKIVYEG